MESLWRRLPPSSANAPCTNQYIAFPHQFLNRDLKHFVRVHQLERLCDFWRMISADLSADIENLANKNLYLWGDCDDFSRGKLWNSRLLQRVEFQLKTLWYLRLFAPLNKSPAGKWNRFGAWNWGGTLGEDHTGGNHIVMNDFEWWRNIHPQSILFHYIFSIHE
jgi:hypothetical protein